MDAPLTLLYTHNLRGDLSLLPRLHTFIRQLKALPVDDEDDVMICLIQPQTRRTLVMDMGNSCDPTVWHCEATGGRSTLVVLDAMGYNAANVTGQLAPGARERMGDLVQMVLVDADHLWREADTLAAPTRQPEPTAFQIIMKPGSAARLEGRAFYPAALTAGQIGIAHFSAALGLPRLIAHDVLTLPPGTPPDPTIAGTVDFVLSEARQFQKKQSGR